MKLGLELGQKALEADNKMIAEERSEGQRKDTEEDHLVQSELRDAQLGLWLRNTERPSLLCGSSKHTVLQHQTTFTTQVFLALRLLV